MLRTSLIIVIIASLAAGTIGFIQVKEKIVTTMNERDNEKSEKVKAQTELASTKKDLGATKDKLKNTETKLASTETELKSVTAKVDELDKIKIDLTAALEKTKGERDAAQATLMQWDILNLKPEQVKGLLADIKKAEAERDTVIKENKLLVQKKNELQALIDRFFGDKDAPPPQLPMGLRGKILAVDQKFQFVVLDVGADQGVKERGELLVSRNGNMIAKVQVATVDKSRCIANILPGWQKGDLLEGDLVIAALVN